jgi:MoxR-like ATPase
MPANSSPDRQLAAFCETFTALRQEIGKLIVGQAEAVDAALAALVAGGHLLIEGPPGLGKTTLARAMALAVGLSFQRIQFTPDLMPSDLLGTYVVMETPQGRRTFEFQKGPIFANLVLADQINRGTPKTQSALLEAMEGQEITVARESFQLPQPFLVVATQNPVEMEGTFPLPEPQLDRFLLKVLVAPPGPAEMEQILDRTTEAAPPLVRAAADGKRLLDMRAIARAVPIDANLRRRVIRLVAATHPDHADAPEPVRRFVRYGASPRGAQAVITAAKVRAAAAARPAVSDADVLAVVPAALRHRLILNFEGQTEAVSPDRLIEGILEAIR